MNELQTVNGGMTAQRTPETVAAEIRTLTGMMLGTAVEIGRRMVEVKAMLPHGEFLPWIKEHTGHSASSANNYMRLFEEYGADQGGMFGAEFNCQTFGNLGISKALALLSVGWRRAVEKNALLAKNLYAVLAVLMIATLLPEFPALLQKKHKRTDTA